VLASLAKPLPAQAPVRTQRTISLLENPLPQRCLASFTPLIQVVEAWMCIEHRYEVAYVYEMSSMGLELFSFEENMLEFLTHVPCQSVIYNHIYSVISWRGG
jgi:hypothetical protein